MIWSNIQYDWPGAAYLLFIVLLIAWALISLFRFRQKKLNDFASSAILNAVVEQRNVLSFWAKSTFYCLAWICAVLAIMQPKGNEHYLTPTGLKPAQEIDSLNQKGILRRKMHDVILLIDVSASMKINDAHEEESRLEVAKEIADNIISQLDGQNISLYAFTSATLQIVPSTLDYLFTRLMLRNIQINEGETEGTDIKQALKDIRKNYFSSSSNRPKTLVIFSDGGDTLYESLQGSAKEQALQIIVKPIEDAKSRDLHVYVVGIGSLKGKDVPGIKYDGRSVLSSLDESLLKRIAIASQGQFIITNQSTPLQVSDLIVKGIYQSDAFQDQTTERSQSMIRDQKIYDLYFQFPLGIAIASLVFSLLLPNTHKRKSEQKG